MNYLVDSSGNWLPEANYYQQQLFLPMVPLSMKMMNAAAASASDFHVNNEYNHSYSDLSNSMADNVAGRNRTEEADRYLRMQIELLKSNLEQQWKQLVLLLIQKEKELAEGKKGAMKLLTVLKKALLEKQKWEKLARKLYGMVSALNKTIEPCFSSTGEVNREEEVASCNEEEDEVDEPTAKRRRRSSHGSSSPCQNCSSSSACVLILPCRHLCLCKQCEILHCRCPVCKCVKKETMVVLFS